MDNIIHASFVCNGFKDNSVFRLDHYLNRDDCLYPYYLIKERFKRIGVEINTSDIAKNYFSQFELHMNIQNSVNLSRSYLLMLESPLLQSRNDIFSYLSSYRKIFTWDDSLVDNNRFIKINLPNRIIAHGVDGFHNRDIFCSLIAGNKSAPTNDLLSLYPERAKVIRWFEKNAPHDFRLFGIGWDIPILHGGVIGKIERRMFRVLGNFVKLRPFPSYAGKIERKSEVLSRSRFSICYENMRDQPGYITEKIFDCLISGCIPVYWGASNIDDYIPKDCFIDRRDFQQMQELYSFLRSMTEGEYMAYQHRIGNFLSSGSKHPFSAEYFAETIVNTIAEDLVDKP